MKKLITAVAAVISLGLSFVHAADMNFDGKITGGVNLMEVIKAVDVSQCDKDIKSVSKTGENLYPIDTEWWQNEINPAYCVSTSSGSKWWSCVVASADVDINGIATVPQSPYLNKSIDQATIKKLAGYFMSQDQLRKIILAYFSAHNDFSLNIIQMAQDAKTIILYDNRGVYFANGKILYGINDNELIKKAGLFSNHQTKISGWDDVALAVVLGCAFSDDCREDVSNYVHNLHDDEHDTYHNNHDGSSPGYEVNKNIK